MKNGIYIIRNIVNGKVYIGQTQELSYRFRKYKETLKSNRHVNKHLQNAWNKYGEICFEFIVSQYCLIEQLTWQEQATFNYFKKFVGVYNQGDFTDSPTRGRKWNHSQESKNKMSIAKMGNKNPMKKKENKKRLSKSLSGRKLSENHRQNLKISSHKVRPERFVRIERIDLFTGEIKEYESIKATKIDGFEPGTVSHCLAGKRNSHKGFAWQYC